MPRSRRNKKALTTQTGMEVHESWCRMCVGTRPASEFYPTTNPRLDKNGLMSICKEHVTELFEKIYSSTNNVSKTIFEMCKLLDTYWDERAVESAIQQCETRGWDKNKLYGVYKSKLLVIHRTSVTDTDVDLSYQYPTTVNISKTEIDDNAFEGAAQNLKAFWGDKFEEQDYVWLQNEYNDWKSRHEIKTKSQEELLKMIVLKSFDIRKARDEDRDASSLEKNFRELLKTSGLSPLDMNAAGGGKSKDCFGVWLREISEKRPEEWVEDKSVYSDVDNLEQYTEKNIKSPLVSLTTGNREFTVEGDEIVEDEDGE
jgi:hypothetical protein